MQHSVLTYCLTSAAILLLGVLVYYCLFSRSTYLKWNRGLLWVLLVASLSIPCIHLSENWTIWGKSATALPETSKEALKADFAPSFVIDQPQIDNQTVLIVPAEPKVQPVSISLLGVLFLLYALGCLVLTLRFVFQILSLWKLYHKARIEQRDGYCLAICSASLSPFTFGRTVFISEGVLDHPDLEMVLAHESVHVRQWHTLDILLAELFLIWQWFNPGAWLYRRLVKTNLEYLADRSVLQQKWNKKQYQLSILNWASPNAGNSLASTYHFSPLKERIMMMNRKSSPKAYLFRYALTGILLPCLLLFNRPAANQTEQPQASLPGTTESFTALDTAPLAVVALPKSKETIQKLTTNQALHRVKQDTIPPQEDVISFILLLNPNLSPQLQEKLQKEKWPFGKKLDLLKNDTGRIIGATITNAKGGSSSGSNTANSDLPIVIYGYEDGAGVSRLNYTLLDQLIAGTLPKTTKVIAYGVPLDPNGLEPYRAKIVNQDALDKKYQLEQLTANHWIDTDGHGSTTYRIPVQPETWESITQRIQNYEEANKSYHIVLNGQVIQSNLPQIDFTKIKKMELHEKFKTEYVEGTLKVKNTERVGLRLEIETE